MNRLDRKRIALHILGEIFGQIGEANGTIKLQAQRGATELRLAGEPEEIPEEAINASPLKPPMPANNPEWLWLSPTEDALVRVATEDWLSADELCRLAGLQPTNEIKTILRNLADRRILDRAQGRGFRLHLKPPSGGEQAPQHEAG